jgi:hypothetical protein
VLSFISLNHPLLIQNLVLKLHPFTTSLGAQLTIAFINATNSTIVKYCTMHPLGPQFAKETCWLHTGCSYHPDMGCLFRGDNALQPLATLENKVVWRWGRYLARSIDHLRTVMWIREDKPVQMIEDMCKEEIWRGPQVTVVSIQPWDLDNSPKHNLHQWAPKEEEAVWDQELAPKYEEGWFEVSFPDVLEVQEAGPDATWIWNEDAEEWVLDEPGWNGEMEDRIAQWHEPKENWD